MLDLIKRFLLFISGLRPAPVRNEPVPEIAAARNEPWISLEQFRKAAGLSGVKAQGWYPHVSTACMEFGITSPARIAAYIAQVGHESGGFVYTREIWGPTTAQQRYEGRADLGNRNIGDGRRFAGRGLIQITGRSNYEAVSKGLGIDFVNDPILLEHPANAARSAAWWWANNGCNQIADTGDFERLTKRINGGTNGLADRLERWNRAKQYV